jgi:type II secretory pathway component PulM
MKLWLQSRSGRELIALSCCGLSALGTLLFITLSPVVLEYRRLVNDIPLLRADLAWMRANVDEARRRKGLPRNNMESNTQASMLLMVETALGKAGLKEQFTEMRQDGTAGVNIKFDDVIYAKLAEFVYVLDSNYHASVKQARVTRIADKPGRVSAAMVVTAE